MAEAPAVPAATARTWYLFPAAERDAALRALFCDAATMMPSIPCLHAPTTEAWAARRQPHRKQYTAGKACVWDMVCAADGCSLVGSSGFRSVSDGEAEWGIVIAADRRRAGLCGEALDVAVAFTFFGLRWLEYRLRIA